MELLELLSGVKACLREAFSGGVWVRAEIAQLSDRGHCYMDLIQTRDGVQVARCRALVWASRYASISAEYRAACGEGLKAGIEVMLHAEVNFSELYGLSLIVDGISPEYTLGEAERIRRETVERLRSEGLLEAQKRLQLPDLPYRLAVISSGAAAGFGDFRRQLTENVYGYVFDIVLVEAALQGPEAPGSISSALSSCAGDGFDAILILRGGGSVSDLACFDDYGLAVSIARCPVPVFTAIGHDRDHHVADMVAFSSVKTPTALADKFVEMFVAGESKACAFATRISKSAAARIAAAAVAVDSRKDSIRKAVAIRIALEAAGLDALEARIAAASPLQLLDRGYALVCDGRGVVVKGVSSLKKGDRVSVRMKDGSAEVEIKEVKYGEV